MPDRTDIAYLYDGSFDGLMCCVFESYYEHQLPETILGPDEVQSTLFELLAIESDAQKAKRVERAISQKISPEALDFVRRAFLTCMPRKELCILDFLRAGFKLGPRIMDMLTDDRVAVLKKAVLHLDKESGLYHGFVRFSEIGGLLVSVIEPKNYVLPLLMEHFCDRLHEENFLIYDKTHSMMLLGEKGKPRLGTVDSFEPGDADYEERGFRSLWQSFYDAIGIAERFNPRCRMSHMPKRYWAQMTEFWEKEPQNAALPEKLVKPLLEEGSFIEY